jgi:hypothetical protein
VSTIIGKPKFVFKQAPIKTIAVTVTKTNLDGLDGDVRIAMATNFDTLEKTNKVINQLLSTPSIISKTAPLPPVMAF